MLCTTSEHVYWTIVSIKRQHFSRPGDHYNFTTTHPHTLTHTLKLKFKPETFVVSQKKKKKIMAPMKTETDPSTSKKPEPTLKLKCDHRDYPYECDKLNCHALFKSKKSLRQHTKNKHLKDWNKTMPRLHCSNCDEIFRSPAHLRSHQDFCINKKNYYPCEKFGEKFTRKKYHNHRKLCYGLQ